MWRQWSCQFRFNNHQQWLTTVSSDLFFCVTTLPGTFLFVWPPTWDAFASPTFTLPRRRRSEDPSSCSGPMRNGPSSACPTSHCSASTRSLPSRWPRAPLRGRWWTATSHPHGFKQHGSQTHAPLHQVKSTGAGLTGLMNGDAHFGQGCVCCFIFLLLSVSLVSTM